MGLFGFTANVKYRNEVKWKTKAGFAGSNAITLRCAHGWLDRHLTLRQNLKPRKDSVQKEKSFADTRSLPLLPSIPKWCW